MTILSSRKDLGVFLNSLNLKNEGVELGVNTGEFSRIILSHWEGSKLHLVDAWEKQDNLIYNDLCNHGSQDHYISCYQQTCEKFKNNNRVKIYRNYSEHAVTEFKDKSLDFVYLDANHSFKATYEDICRWNEKVKDGGILSGHDYVNGYFHNSVWFGSKYAVDKWAAENGYQVYFTWEDGMFPSWYIFKNKTDLSNKKILLLSGHTGSSDLLEKIKKNHKAYANKVGCDYIFENENHCIHRHHQWNKLKWIKKHQDNYDWIIWVDADVVFMNDKNSIITHINDQFDFISAIYHTNIVNSGLLIVGSTPEAKELMDLSWELSEDTRCGYPHEEKALTQAFKPFHRSRTFLCAMDVFNNHPGPWYKENAPQYHITSYHRNRDAIVYDFLSMSEF